MCTIPAGVFIIVHYLYGYNPTHYLTLTTGPTFLLELQFSAALRKQIAAGYKNVRIDAALLLELGQKSFLTGNI